MANKNRNLIVAYFPSKDAADDAGQKLKHWDKEEKEIKLGGMGIITEHEGELKTHLIGAHAGGTGAKWGSILGATGGLATGIMAAAGVLTGGAALAVMADAHEVDPTKAELTSLGGNVEHYLVPDEVMEELDDVRATADEAEATVAERIAGWQETS